MSDLITIAIIVGYAFLIGFWTHEYMTNRAKRLAGKTDAELCGEVFLQAANSIRSKRKFIGEPEEGQTVTITEGVRITFKGEQPMRLEVVSRMEG